MNNIETLREHLFATLQGLKDQSIDTETAKTMGEIGQVLINSAKVEVDFVRANGGGKSEFFQTKLLKEVSQTETGTKTVEGFSTVHKLRG